MEEFAHHHVETRFSSLPEQMRYTYIVRMYHPDRTDPTYSAAPNALRAHEFFAYIKNKDKWAEYFSQTDAKTLVTLPGTSDTEDRTYHVPETLDSFYLLLFRYSEYMRGLGAKPRQEDYPPVAQDAASNEDVKTPEEDKTPELLRPFLKHISAATNAQELIALFGRIKGIGFLPEQLIRVPIKKGSRETLNLLEELNKRGLTLLTEQRGDIARKADLQTFAQTVFDFPFLQIHYETQQKKFSYILSQEYNDKAKALVLGVFAEWVRNSRKTRTLDDARAILKLLPEKKFYSETREQLESIISERERRTKRKTKE